MFTTVSQVRKANKATGQAWFAPDAMSFFNTVIETDLINGKRGDQYFITSERADLDDPKRYAIREVEESGKVTTVGMILEYETLRDARIALRNLKG